MTDKPTNKETVLRYYEDLSNARLADRFEDYFTEESIFHTAHYVGTGVSTDDTSGDKVVITHVAKGGPADGYLCPGDQLLQVTDEKHIWETYKELREMDWGQGIIDTPLTVRVLRDSQVLDVQFKRGIVRGFDQRQFDFKEILRYYTTKVWPDQKVVVDHLVEEGDLVMVHGQISGTNMEYHRQAVWDFVDIFKIRNGKFLEAWGVENSISQFKQLGYRIIPPD